ncbi:MAG: hypothetical protein J6034_11350 [Bacteroidaceae bacterium]|nr:hypothetical protein [Bacteroidaceae bacterium]
MKKYIDAQLQVVRVNKSDIIVTSDPALGSNYKAGDVVLGADRFRDWED